MPIKGDRFVAPDKRRLFPWFNAIKHARGEKKDEPDDRKNRDEDEHVPFPLEIYHQ